MRDTLSILYDDESGGEVLLSDGSISSTSLGRFFLGISWYWLLSSIGKSPAEASSLKISLNERTDDQYPIFKGHRWLIKDRQTHIVPQKPILVINFKFKSKRH